MGVYIKNMEMPTSCGFCVFEQETGDGCECYVNGCLTEYQKRPDDCPLVPVPPHGDLIERDALRASIKESIEECNKWADEVDKDTMMYARISQSIGTFVECSLRAKAAPTIIPASGGNENE